MGVWKPGEPPSPELGPEGHEVRDPEPPVRSREAGEERSGGSIPEGPTRSWPSPHAGQPRSAARGEKQLPGPPPCSRVRGCHGGGLSRTCAQHLCVGNLADASSHAFVAFQQSLSVDGSSFPPSHGTTDNPAAGQALEASAGDCEAFILQRLGILVAKLLEPLLMEEEMVTALSLGSASCNLGMSSA